MNKNKNLILLFMLFSGCGLSTNNQSIADMSLDNISGQYYTNSDSSIQVRLDRNKDYGNSKFTKMQIIMQIPKEREKNASILPDFLFALQIQEINPGPHVNDPTTQTISISDEPQDSNKPTTNTVQETPFLYSGLFTFGDLSRANQFLIPQEVDKAPRVAFTNIISENQQWQYAPIYSYHIKEKISLKLDQFIYNVNNQYGGCASHCVGATAIIPTDSTDPRILNYSINFWLWDSMSTGAKIDRSNTIIKISTGFIDRKGLFHPFDDTKTLLVDFSMAETYQQYKKRIYKEKKANIPESDTSSKNTALNKFFNSLNGKKN